MKNCTNLLVLCYFLSGVTGNMLITNHQLLKVRIMTVITLFLAVVIILIIIYQQNLKNKECTIRRLSPNLQNYIQQQKENEIRIKQNKEYIRSFQDQQTGQQKDLEPEQTSQISQPEQQNKNLAPANQELQEQIETSWKKLKETPLRTQHIQELTTEMLLLKEREQKLTGQLIAIHPLMNELRNSPRFMRPEDLAVLRQLTDEIYQDFYFTAEQPLYEPDGCGHPTLYSDQARFQHFTNSHTDGNISNLRIPAEIKNKETYPTAGTRQFC
ncbi:hypothetical protein [Phocaeicola coprophilus]|uniref:hypothetical protein n=1 Tax=Phocaeicola coprophilus TaxID=387090 RepID=UPI002673DA32|nr:hypothetical protein [Phocaeicola coprophilus]